MIKTVDEVGYAIRNLIVTENTMDAYEKIQVLLKEWSYSIVDECSDKVNNDNWEYVQQVKEQL